MLGATSNGGPGKRKESTKKKTAHLQVGEKKHFGVGATGVCSC